MTKQKWGTLVRAAALAAAASCADLNEEVITGVTDSYYTSAAGFNTAVNASYQPLQSFYGQERGFTLTVFGTDEYTRGADGDHKFYNDYTGQLSGEATFVRDTWNDYYRAINTTNAVIGRGADVPMDEATKAQRIGEARFLRAFYYFDLVRMFGDVPLPLTETREPSTEATREPAAKVYEAIVADLEAAEAALPETQGQHGRATKGAARHLLAKVYLTRAQPGDLAKAADYAQRVINSGQYTLLPRFADVFDLRNERSREVVWSIQFTADPLTTGNGNRGHLYFIMEYDVLPGMQRDVANGRPFKRFRPTNWLLGLHDRSKDSRYDDSFLNVWYANNERTIPKDASGRPRFALGDTSVWLPGTDVSAALRASKPYRIYTPSQYDYRIFPTLKKFLDPTRANVNEERGQRDFLIFRLAETYLIAAEALVRDGKAADAVPFVNAVRRRAAKPGVAPATMDVTPAQLTLDFVLDERSRELAGESMRWFDLVRTGKLVERVRRHNPDAAAGIKEFHVLRPIPIIQIERTTTPFPQNPGY